MQIERLTEPVTDPIRRGIREIFFLSADPRNIKGDPLANEVFFKKWTDFYFTYSPHLIFVAHEDKKMLGYLMGCLDSRAAEGYYRSANPAYLLFSDLFVRFPAHLHINCHPEARGKGIGSALIRSFVDELAKAQVPGVHLVTSPDQQNVAFYRKNGFTFEEERSWKSHPLLFMGRELK